MKANYNARKSETKFVENKNTKVTRKNVKNMGAKTQKNSKRDRRKISHKGIQ